MKNEVIAASKIFYDMANQLDQRIKRLSEMYSISLDDLVIINKADDLEFEFSGEEWTSAIASYFSCLSLYSKVSMEIAYDLECVEKDSEPMIFEGISEHQTIHQCCTCESVFTQLNNDHCPNCFSGNWVYGYIDNEE